MAVLLFFFSFFLLLLFELLFYRARGVFDKSKSLFAFQLPTAGVCNVMSKSLLCV